jgi:hypothetical protein
MSETKTKKTTKKNVRAPVKEHPKKHSFKFLKPATKAEKQEVTAKHNKLPSEFKLLSRTFKQLIKHWQLLGGILVVYAIIDLVLVGGNTTSTSLPVAKSGLQNFLHGQVNNFTSGFTLFSFLVNSGNTSNNDAASAYELVLLLIISVVYIWALRQIYANQKVRIRDAFYVGTYPLIPFVLILLVMGIQLLPLAIGASIYTNLLNGGYLIGMIPHLFAVLIFLLFASWTVYMLCSSIIALYIVTLPEMTPWRALMAARDLVRFRRWIVLRKLIFLIVMVALGGVILLIPIALFATPAAMLFFLLLTALTVGVIHSYIYELYREML